jgi:hypothetical protein
MAALKFHANSPLRHARTSLRVAITLLRGGR